MKQKRLLFPFADHLRWPEPEIVAWGKPFVPASGISPASFRRFTQMRDPEFCENSLCIFPGPKRLGSWKARVGRKVLAPRSASVEHDTNMKDDQLKFLSLLDRPPGRFTPEQTAWALNFQEHDIPVLCAVRLLKPLGSPPENGLKFFGADEIMELATDRTWLAKATNAIHQHWKRKNERRKNLSEAGLENAADS